MTGPRQQLLYWVCPSGKWPICSCARESQSAEKKKIQNLFSGFQSPSLPQKLQISGKPGHLVILSPARNTPSCQLLPAGRGWLQSGSLFTCSVCSCCVYIVKTHRLVCWWAVNKQKKTTNTLSYLKGKQSMFHLHQSHKMWLVHLSSREKAF